jgi:tetratricopeptide (TPR) repeat protein
VAEEAVALYRGLVAERPGTFKPGLAAALNNLARMLGEVGRKEAALAAIEEAVSIRYALAAERPDAFQADLAMSLWVSADRLAALARTEQALARNADAITTLMPRFSSKPEMFANQMSGMVRDHLEYSKRLGRDPDMTLLAPVIRLFGPLLQRNADAG